MKHQWLAYVIVAILSIGAGVAIAGLPDSVPESETIIPPSTTLAPEPTVPATTTPTSTTPPEESADTEPEDATTSTEESDDTTTTIQTIEPRADVAVAVANGSGESGVAVATAGELVTLGYVSVAALNGSELVDTTTVYYVEGNDGVAERMAADLGLPPEAVEPFEIAPDVEELGIVQLLVYVGADRA